MKIIENNNNLTILENNNKTYLISYTTTICEYDATTKSLKININYWDYSQTTLKHFKYFINNYTCYNYETKKTFEIYVNNNINNIRNIEFVENL